MSIRNRLLPLLAIFLPLVAGAQVAPQPSLDGWPDWFQDAMSEELRRMKLRNVKFPVEGIAAKLPGKPADAQQIEDGWYLYSDIKAGSPLECYVMTTATDIATMANNIAEINIDSVMANNNATPGDRNAYYVDAGEVHGYPFLALEWVYQVKTDAGVQMGMTKVRVASKNDLTYACAHNYLGYRESFATAFAEFVANVEVPSTSAKPYYEEIAVMNLNDIGYSVIYTSFTNDEEGDTREYSVNASIVPVDKGTIMFSDSITITWSRPDRTTINSISVDTENGEITTQLDLQRDENGDWVSSGTFQGKELSSTIDGALQPASSRAVFALTRELFAGDAPSADMQLWIPAADPTTFVGSSIVRTGDADARTGDLIMGPIRMSGTFDEYGNIESGSMAMGPAQARIERIWSAGELD